MKKYYFGLPVFRLISLVALLHAAIPATISAATLPPGGFLTPVPQEPDPMGAALVDQLVQPYTGADIQGTLVSSVWAADINNPYPGLTFTYQIFTDFASAAVVEGFTVGNYGPFATDVSYDFGDGGINVIAVAGVAPVYAGRTANGNVVSFDFSLFGAPGIMPGEGSTLLVIQTDAGAYAPTIASVINSGSAEVLSFAPEPVPEPATFALIGFGTLTLLLARRRR